MQQIPKSLPRVQAERAILKTVLYSDLFDYALTIGEVVHYLAETAGCREQVEAILASPHGLNGQIVQVDGYFTMPGREDLVNRRRARNLTSRRLWRMARLYGKLLSCLPFVRMVAVTGALAMDNSDEHDDVDVLIVTAPARVWLARAFAVLIVYAGKLTATRLCPNFVLSEGALSLEPRTVYVAHEFVQMVPLSGFAVYQRMRAANLWVRHYLPNAEHPLHHEPEYHPGFIPRSFKHVAEWLLSGRLGDRLEAWEMRRKIRKFTALSAVGGSVVFNRHQVKGHFDDHGTLVSAEYQCRLEENNLDVHESS
ncbi:MAG: hypothetical protein LAP85_12815 [Acidobacteriia bacterium]|nr:hypothetical protein [Terriglobia bacterium]